jgi:hypothetical protein
MKFFFVMIHMALKQHWKFPSYIITRVLILLQNKYTLFLSVDKTFFSLIQSFQQVSSHNFYSTHSEIIVPIYKSSSY